MFFVLKHSDVYDICVHPDPEYAEQLYERFRLLVDDHLEAQQQVNPPLTPFLPRRGAR